MDKREGVNTIQGYTRKDSVSSTDSNGTNKTFAFPDNTMLTGDIYYRLRMSDIAGQITYSQVGIGFDNCPADKTLIVGK